MADEFKIRPGRRGDRDAIAGLLKELGYPQGGDAGTVFWVINHPEIDLFVAIDQLDRPIGFLTLSYRPQLRLNGRIATVDELVVAASWRSKRVGSKLLATAIARAKALSVKRLEISTHLGRSQYRRSFYERNGFVEVDAAVLRLREFEK